MNAIPLFCHLAYIALIALATLRTIPIRTATVERLDGANILVAVAIVTQVVTLVTYLMTGTGSATRLTLVAFNLAACALIFAFNLRTANRLEREAGRR